MGLFDNYDGNMGSMGGMEDMQNPNPGLLSGIQGWLANPRNAAGLQAFGAALAKAGGPQRPSQFAGWGGGLSEALTGLTLGKQNYDQQNLDRLFQNAKIKDFMAQSVQREAMGKKTMQQMDSQQQFLSRLNGGVSSVPPMAEMGGAVPSQDGTASSQGGISNLSLNDLAGAAVSGIPGAKELLDIKKLQMQGTAFEQGKTYQFADGRERYMPKLGEGQMQSPSGQVSLAPGASDANAAFKGAEIAATEKAKQTVGLDTPQIFSGMGKNGGPAYGTPRQLSGGKPDGTVPPHLAAIANQLNANGIGFVIDDTGNIKIDTSVTPKKSQAMAGGMVSGSSPAEIDISKKIAEAKLENDKINSQLIPAISMARGLLKDATGSGAGALVDSGMGFFGESTKSADAAKQLDTLGGWMTSNVPRFEGPQSDNDRLHYKIMAAQVGDRTVPISQRLAALDTLEKIRQVYKNGLSENGYVDQKSNQMNGLSISAGPGVKSLQFQQKAFVETRKLPDGRTIGMRADGTKEIIP